MKDSSLNLKILNFADEVDSNVLWDKIQRFRSMNKEHLSMKELQNEILDVISFNNVSLLNLYTQRFYPNHNMFRIRKLENKTIPNKDIKVTSDAWSPAAKYVTKLGRLNKVGESLLYVCPDIYTAIKETKTKVDEPFALMVYDVVEEIKATSIGLNQNFDSFAGENKMKMRLIHDFLKEEFSRDVAEGLEHLYRVSEIIAKDYFDLPPRDMQDAWVYPSIADKPSINLCLRPELAAEKLTLKGVLIVENYTLSGREVGLNVLAVAKDDQDGVMEYFEMNSEEQKRLFPDLHQRQ